MGWLSKLFGGGESTSSSGTRRTADGLIDVPLDCPKCKHKWVAGFKSMSKPTKVNCPKCGWQGTMSING